MAVDRSSQATRSRWDARYASGPTPWDTQTTPPEVVDFWASERLPRTRLALDLGCGPGTNLRYLARIGLHPIGVDIASAALTTAQHRLQTQEPDLVSRIDLVQADVCALPFQNLGADYVLDIGCLHSLPTEVRPLYAEGILSNLAPHGYYHLYAFDRPPQEDEAAPRGPVGLAEGEVAQLFTPELQIVEETIAQPDRRPCRWYLLQRPG